LFKALDWDMNAELPKWTLELYFRIPNAHRSTIPRSSNPSRSICWLSYPCSVSGIYILNLLYIQYVQYPSKAIPYRRRWGTGPHCTSRGSRLWPTPFSPSQPQGQILTARLRILPRSWWSLGDRPPEHRSYVPRATSKSRCEPCSNRNHDGVRTLAQGVAVL